MFPKAVLGCRIITLVYYGVPSRIYEVGFEILSAVVMKNCIFW
jgi:hypothetical protein